MRLAVQKTLKMYVKGAFIRSESGRVLRATSRDGVPMNVCQASRKDLRDAIGVNRGALASWSGATAYNRGQILYRLAEMLEGRGASVGVSEADLEAAIDRAVHHAGWTDKIGAVLSTLNPVAAAYVNYSMVRPIGVVVALPDPADGLLGLVETTCQILVMGNVGTLIVPADHGELAAAYAEALHTSDLPAGAINVLTGDVAELLGAANTHDDLDVVLAAGAAVTDAQWATIEREGAAVLRRLVRAPGAATPAGPDLFARLAEVKTVWMSAGAEIPQGGGAY
jgi:acyl-CoA reductase-like NAD-dependent aldehyde dehydrogenase